MHQIRHHLRGLAAAVLVSVSALGAWSTFAHGLDCFDHDDAVVAVVVHDASAHVFSSAAPADEDRPIHCVLCHWTRAFGPSVQSVAAVPSQVDRSVAIPVDDATAPRLLATAQPPLRAPPSASTPQVAA
ncbi:MAG TPA: hypothetical protein VFO31_26155 [Vicinamibacterales bacterium]|nr:hypothetical protein [Vicinamibacterales bacterium]